MDRGSFTLPPSVQAATEESRYVADPVRAFLRERTIGGADQWVAKADLYRAYEAWCTETGFQGMAAATFYERVHAAAVDVFGSPLRESKRNRGTRGLNGLRLATPADHAEAPHGGTRGTLVPVPSQPVITRERMSTPASSASIASREMTNLDPGVRTGPDSGDPAIRDEETALAAEPLGVARQQHIDLFDELELPDSPHADDGPAA